MSYSYRKSFRNENPYGFQGIAYKSNPHKKGIVRLLDTAYAPIRRVAGLIVSRQVIPAAYDNENIRNRKKEEKEEFLKEHDSTTHEVKLTTHDNACLDGVVIFHSEEETFNDDPSQQRWVILVNGQTEYYETFLEQSHQFGKDLKANVFTFNYRGVGESGGHPQNMDDLVTDAVTGIQYLLSKGIPEKNIIIKGHSLGGGIATVAASKFDKVNLINTNSYASISAVPRAGSIPIVNLISSIFIKVAGWDLKVTEAYNNVGGRKLLVYHKDDQKIPKAASLYQAVKKQQIRNEIRKDKEKHKLRPNKKYGIRYVKLKNRIGVIDKAEVVNLDGDISENLKLKEVGKIRLNMRRDLVDKYEKGQCPKMLKFPVKNIDDFKAEIDDEIERLNKAHGNEEVIEYYRKRLLEIEAIPDRDNVEPRAIDGHSRLSMEDQKYYTKILKFAENTFKKKQ